MIEQIIFPGDPQNPNKLEDKWQVLCINVSFESLLIQRELASIASYSKRMSIMGSYEAFENFFNPNFVKFYYCS